MRTKRKSLKRKDLRRKSFKRKTLKRKTLKKKNWGGMLSLRCDKLSKNRGFMKYIDDLEFLDDIQTYLGVRTWYEVAIEKKGFPGRKTVWKRFNEFFNLKRDVDRKITENKGTLSTSPKLTKTNLYHTISGEKIKGVCRKRFKEINEFMKWCNSSPEIKAHVKATWFTPKEPTGAKTPGKNSAKNSAKKSAKKSTSKKPEEPKEQKGEENSPISKSPDSSREFTSGDYVVDLGSSATPPANPKQFVVGAAVFCRSDGSLGEVLGYEYENGKPVVSVMPDDGNPYIIEEHGLRLAQKCYDKMFPPETFRKNQRVNFIGFNRDEIRKETKLWRLGTVVGFREDGEILVAQEGLLPSMAKPRKEIREHDKKAMEELAKKIRFSRDSEEILKIQSGYYDK